MKLIRVGLAALAMVFITPVPGVSALGGSLATCAGAWKVNFNPGVGLTSGVASFTTNGNTGTIVCVGSVEGSPVTGPGTYGKQGIFNGSCFRGTGTGTMTVNVPTAAGLKQLSIPFTMVTAPGLAFKSGESLLGPLTFAFVPNKGNCVLSRITEITALGEFTLQT